MTYIPTWAGFLYLAVVIDVFSREVVGRSFGETMTASLVISALNMALVTRKDRQAFVEFIIFSPTKAKLCNRLPQVKTL